MTGGQRLQQVKGYTYRLREQLPEVTFASKPPIKTSLNTNQCYWYTVELTWLTTY